MKTVTGPGDVKPGDLVEFAKYDPFRTTYEIVTVAKVGKSRLTFNRASGETGDAPYTRIVTSRTFRRTERRTHHNFRLLEAMDLWRHRKPSTNYASPTLQYGRNVVSVVITAPALLTPTDLAVVHDEIDQIAAWMAEMPAEAGGT